VSYVQAAEHIGANSFNLWNPLYNVLNRMEAAWTANQAFLNASIYRGQQFYLATTPGTASGTFAMELEYLISRGVGELVPTNGRWLALTCQFTRRGVPVGQALNDLIVGIIRPPLVVLRFVMEKTYKIFFGWWLDELLVNRENEKFAEEIREHLYFLFESYGAKVIPNEQQPPALFDFASVTILVGKIVLRFDRGHGDVTVSVASVGSPRDWHELSTLLSVMDVGVQRQAFSGLDGVGRILRSHMNDIERALSSDHYFAVKERLSDIDAHDRAVRRQWETEINRRFYQK